MKARDTSTLTCPHCGFAERLAMPTDACQFFHRCGKCGELLRPLTGDCCVFCSFGDAPCPPRQLEAQGVAAACQKERT